QNTLAGRVRPSLDPISLCCSPYPSSAPRPCVDSFFANSSCRLPALQVQRPQAVARAAKYRSEIGEPGDEDDRRPGGEIEVIRQQQPEEPRGKGQGAARRAERPQLVYPETGRRSGQH